MTVDESDSNAGVTSSRIPFCEPRCPHASFPQVAGVDGSGSCRTFSALWCDAVEEFVTKNAPCRVKFGRRRPKTQW